MDDEKLKKIAEAMGYSIRQIGRNLTISKDGHNLFYSFKSFGDWLKGSVGRDAIRDFIEGLLGPDEYICEIRLQDDPLPTDRKYYVNFLSSSGSGKCRIDIAGKGNSYPEAYVNAISNYIEKEKKTE